MNTSIPVTLSVLGLSEMESNVYMALLQLGTCAASTVAKRLDINRSTARYTCEQLVQKRICMLVDRGGTFLFTAEHPARLISLLDEEKNEIDQKKETVQLVMGDLMQMMNLHSTLPKVQFFEGVNGIIKMFDDVLEEGETLFGAFRLGPNVHPDILQYIESTYIPKRKELGNTAYMLVNANEATTAYRERDKEMNRITLQMDKAQYPFDTCMHVYGKKVAFYSYDEQDLTGVLIQNENIFQTQQALFRMAWERALTQKENLQYREVLLPI